MLNKDNNYVLGLNPEDITNSVSNDQDIYKNLPDSLIKKGWILYQNILKIPVINTEYYLAIEYKKARNDKDFIYYWSDRESKKGMFLTAKLFLNEDLPPRTNKLLDYAKANKIDIDKTFFINPEIIDPLNEYNIEKILKENYQITEDLKENSEVIRR